MVAVDDIDGESAFSGFVIGGAVNVGDPADVEFMCARFKWLRGFF